MKNFLKIFLLIINIILSLLLIFTFFLPDISGLFKLKLFIPFILSITFILNILFFVFWLFVKWKYSFISLVSLLISIKYFLMILPLSFFSNSQKSRDEFRIMSYNVMVFGVYNKDENKAHNIRKNIINTIVNSDAEIICLQEAFWHGKKGNFPTISEIQKSLGIKFQHLFAIEENKVADKFGFVTLSKYPIVGKFEYRFNKSFNGFIYSDILIGEDTIRIYNCHLNSFNFKENDYHGLQNLVIKEDMSSMHIFLFKYLEAARIRFYQLDTLFLSIDTTKYPVFVCGDFNDFPLSLTYLRMRKKFSDSYISCGKFPGYTWQYLKLKLRIDYIFYDKKYFECSEHKILQELGSDHYGIIAGFRKLAN